MRDGLQIFVWIAAAFSTLLSGPHALAAGDEIDRPAGDLPADGSQATLANIPAKKPGKKPKDAPATPLPMKSGKGTAAKGQGGSADIGSGAAADHWDSYVDLGHSSAIAKEVTGGMRVEDIVEPPSEYHYAAFGKPDPFVPPLMKARDVATSVSGLEIPLVSPLQRWDLDALHLVGIWQLSSGERKGLVMAPGGEKSGEIGVIIKSGDLIGIRGGKVLAIGSDYLTVREFSLAPDGTRQFGDRQKYMENRKVPESPGKIRFTPGKSVPEVIESRDDPAAALGNDKKNDGLNGKPAVGPAAHKASNDAGAFKPAAFSPPANQGATQIFGGGAQQPNVAIPAPAAAPAATTGGLQAAPNGDGIVNGNLTNGGGQAPAQQKQPDPGAAANQIPKF